MSETVLVTGIDGFTGAHAKRILNDLGHKVFGVSNIKESQDVFLCDLRDGEKIERVIDQVQPTWVVHLAGIASPAHNQVEEFYSSNTVGSVNLLEALATKNRETKKVLLASSSNVYGSQDGKLNEQSVLLPKGHYAASKLAMEFMAKNYFEALPIVVTRPFNYTGVGQRESFVVAKIVAHFRRRAAKMQLGNIDVHRDFLDVRDLVGAYVALLSSDLRSTFVNVCSGKSISLREIISELESQTSHEIEIEVDRELVRPNDIPVMVGDPTLLRSTGFKQEFGFSETLASMLAEES
jgi:nucleoside-diphosphate-sugar epimerase